MLTTSCLYIIAQHFFPIFITYYNSQAHRFISGGAAILQNIFVLQCDGDANYQTSLSFHTLGSDIDLDESNK